MESKKVLIISDCPTDPPIAGNRYCIKENAELLKVMGYEVYFLYIWSHPSKEVLSMMREVWGGHLLLFRTSKLQYFLQKVDTKIRVSFRKNFSSLDLYCPWGICRFVNRLCKDEGIENIIINYIWLSKILKHSIAKNRIIYTHDVFSFKNKKGHSMWFSYTPNREAFALRRANHILAIQENEATYYRYLTPGNDVRVVFMTFPFHPVGSTAQNKSLLFFSGSNEYNIHGIKDFVEKIFPKVTEIWNDAKLIIGGSISKYLDEYKDNKSIKVVGQVDDPKDFYKLGQVVINPTFEGTGLKVKTFEAVSYGKVVLVHHHSLEGIFNKDHAPVYECNSANDYIRKLKEVWSGSYDFKAQSQKCNTYLSDMDKYIERMYQQILG